jgi:signal transduction histidine kinase
MSSDTTEIAPPEETDARQRPPRAPRTFSRRLALAFAVVAALTAALAGLLLSAVWNYQFTQYVQANLQNTADGIAEISSGAYPQLGGWTIQTMSQIPRFGPQSGIGVQILDASGNVVYDDASMSAHVQDVNTLEPGSSNVPKPKILLEPSGSVVTSRVMVGKQQVGTVRVWAYSAGALMTERDMKFKRGSLTGLAVAALVAIAFASIGGAWYARKMVRPIERITATAQALKAGDREARTQLQGDDEIGFLGQTFDEMADSIEADREMERRLTADVAHELRTPLQAIQATVEAMQDGVLPADEERLGIVRDETMRLARLADGILELTRLERGSVPFTCTRIDLALPVRAALDIHEALIETREIVLSVDITERVYACVDSDRLQQAVGNLLSNAARYTPAGGRIDVSVRRDTGQAVIEVADTGMGIAEEDLQQVFSRFWRADEARATTSGGLGIGLAVTKEIVERHKGTIGVSRRHGGGSVFTIRLPLA